MANMDTRQWLDLVEGMRERISILRADPIMREAPPDIHQKTEQIIASVESWVWEVTAAMGDQAEMEKARNRFIEIVAATKEVQEWYAEQQAARTS